MLLALLLVLAQSAAASVVEEAPTADVQVETRSEVDVEIDDALEQLKSADSEERTQAAETLADVKYPASERIAPVLLQRLTDRSADVRYGAVEALGKRGVGDAFPRLLQALTDPKFQEGEYVVKAVAETMVWGDNAYRKLAKAIDGKNVALKARAAEVLAFVDTVHLAEFSEELPTWATDANPKVREAVWKRLPDLGYDFSERALPLLKRCLANLSRCPVGEALKLADSHWGAVAGLEEPLRKARVSKSFPAEFAPQADDLLADFDPPSPTRCPSRSPGEVFPPVEMWSQQCILEQNLGCCFHLGTFRMTGIGRWKDWDAAKLFLAKVCDAENPQQEAACALVAKIKAVQDEQLAEYKKAHPPPPGGWGAGIRAAISQIKAQQEARERAAAEEAKAERIAQVERHQPREHTCSYCDGDGEVYRDPEYFNVRTPIMGRREILTGPWVETGTRTTYYEIPAGTKVCPICHGAGVRVY